MKSAWHYIIANWKTSLGGAIAFVLSVPQAVTAINQMKNGQHVDWAGTAICLVMAAVGLSAKDATNHSTQLQVNLATHDAEQKK
jgi:uncharacterized membrane protein